MAKYRVNINMVWSHDIQVTAKNVREAKQKAFDKFKETKIKAKNFVMYTDKIED